MPRKGPRDYKKEYAETKAKQPQGRAALNTSKVAVGKAMKPPKTAAPGGKALKIVNKATKAKNYK